ncbi:MAG: DUF2892 domain-containing protein [bacterium]|nr:DUF2892 domain-containing protein [bacterium]MBK8129695.1 DUF2892 domain-containing protein [bacterium]
MTMNVGSADRVIRIVIGLAVIGWGIWAKNWWGALGVVPLFTAMINWCPLYTVCGVKTTSAK